MMMVWWQQQQQVCTVWGVDERSRKRSGTTSSEYHNIIISHQVNGGCCDAVAMCPTTLSFFLATEKRALHPPDFSSTHTVSILVLSPGFPPPLPSTPLCVFKIWKQHSYGLFISTFATKGVCKVSFCTFYTGAAVKWCGSLLVDNKHQ